MSGGTSFSGEARSAERSEKVFKSSVEEARETTGEPLRNIFISFHVEDEAQVNLLRSQAKNEDFGMEFRDYSVKEPFDEKWKQNCADRIAQTSMTICMIGKETASRQAVLWELEESYRQGKTVIGVRIHKDRNDPIPESMVRHNAPVITWNRDELNRHLSRE